MTRATNTEKTTEHSHAKAVEVGPWWCLSVKVVAEGMDPIFGV